MGGFFGTISKVCCATDLFYGTDYNSHLGTRRGGMVTNNNGVFIRSIHNLENSYFRTRFESELSKFEGNSGIGIISDTDPQPIFVNSHLGKYAVVTVAKVNNMKELEAELLTKGCHFSELSSGQTNQTELISLLISQGKTFVEGIEKVYDCIKGSCTMLILTEGGLIAARDKWGRTPLLIGKKDGAYAATSEPCSFPNLDYELEYNVGPGDYAEGKQIPYRRAIVKYTPTWPRSFTPSNQTVRDLVARMKLIPNRQLLKGKRVVFCDDSIVRGTQLRDNVNILYGYGAREVHMRIGCPPILHSCPFIGFSASKSALELIARRIVKELEGDDTKDLDKYATTGSEQYNKLVECIRERLNISTLRFNTVEDLIESIGLPKESVCTHCYDGSSCF